MNRKKRFCKDCYALNFVFFRYFLLTFLENVCFSNKFMYMKTHMQKSLFVVLFLGLTGLFSIFRTEISEAAVSLLAMSGEVTLSKQAFRSADGENVAHSTMQIVTDKKYSTTKKSSRRKTTSSSKNRSDIFKKPVTVRLPKTKTPVISYSYDFPDWFDPGLKLFTPLRKYDGKVWRKEKTEIKASTDGKKLYIIIRLYDHDPGNAITKHAQKDGTNAWKDDSIELFLMKNRKSKYYCQYIVSMSGRGHLLYCQAGNTPNKGVRKKLPAGFVKPRFSVDSFDEGFELEMSIDLRNVGISKLQRGDSFLMQVVRNYRGQGDSESVTLHLFPVYIYADKRLGINNHDRRAFQKILVKDE